MICQSDWKDWKIARAENLQHNYNVEISFIFALFFLFQVAYNSDEVDYIWKSMKNGVDYEEKLQLSQFEIKQTEFRGLNFSRGTTSKNFQNNFHLLPNE